MTTPTVHSLLQDAQRGPSSQAQRLAADAATAAEMRTWQTHPDVVALRVEGFRSQVDRLMWAGIVLGLCFTMTNVQQFAAAGSPVGSLPWCSAWLLDPMVSLVLLAVLRAEQLTTRYQVHRPVAPSGQVGTAVGHLCDEHLGILGSRVAGGGGPALGAPAGGRDRR